MCQVLCGCCGTKQIEIIPIYPEILEVLSVIFVFAEKQYPMPTTQRRGVYLGSRLKPMISQYQGKGESGGDAVPLQVIPQGTPLHQPALIC